MYKRQHLIVQIFIKSHEVRSDREIGCDTCDCLIFHFVTFQHTCLLYTSAPDYAERFANYIQSHNQTLLAETLKELSHTMKYTDAPITSIKHMMIDLYLSLIHIS